MDAHTARAIDVFLEIVEKQRFTRRKAEAIERMAENGRIGLQHANLCRIDDAFEPVPKIIRRLAKEGLAVLLISSDLPEALGMSDRIGVMRGGTIAAILPGGSDAQTVMAAALGTAKGAAA